MSSTPPGYSKPFASHSADDHRAAPWVATLLCLAIVTCGTLTRVYVRFKAMGMDDYLIIAAYVLSLAEFATTAAGLKIGLGVSTASLSKTDASSAGSVFLASEALFIITCYVIKHSVLCTVERVLGPDMKMQRIVCWVLHGVVGVSGLASLLTVVVSCSASQLLTDKMQATCADQTSRWIGIAVVDSVLEVAVFGMFCFIISSLQMQVRLKITVATLLAFRIGCIAFAAVHAHYVASYDSSSDLGLGVVGAVVWQQFAMSYSMIAALLVALKGFLQSFDTGSGNTKTYGADSRSDGRTPEQYGLKRLSQKGQSRRTWNRSGTHKEVLGPDRVANNTEYSTQIYHSSEGREGSINSQHPIIKYEVQYSVTHEDPDSHPRSTNS